MIPLAFVELGKTIKVVRIGGGKNFTSRIMSMGLKEGNVLKVISNSERPVLASFGNSKIALGKGISENNVEYMEEK